MSEANEKAMPRELPWLGPVGGWDAVNATGLTREQADKRQEEILAGYDEARLVFDVLGRGRGPELLAVLQGRLIETPVFRLGGQIGHNTIEFPITPEQWLWIRAGQNSVFFWFRDMLAAAIAGPPEVAADMEG
jgi:hypothetical protein